jgi:raffinose/stachyose/melibiose transport system permease protein
MANVPPAPGGLCSVSARPSRKARRSRSRWWPFALPAFLLVCAFFLLPFLLNVRFAFTRWTGYAEDISWNGFDNLRSMAEQGILAGAIEATLTYAVIAMIVQNAFSLTLALALQRSDRVNSVFRALFFLPVLIAPVAAGYIWSAIVAPAGPLNRAIGLVVPGFDYAWLGHGFSALATTAFIDAWKWSGLTTLVYIAGLNAIPRSVIESAVVDGANAWQRFWRIRLRLLAPAFTFTIVVTLIGALSAFDIIMATTRGGPGDATTVLNIAVFTQYGGGFFGTASALSLVVTALVAGIALPLIAFLRSREIEV